MRGSYVRFTDVLIFRREGQQVHNFCPCSFLLEVVLIICRALIITLCGVTPMMWYCGVTPMMWYIEKEKNGLWRFIITAEGRKTYQGGEILNFFFFAISFILNLQFNSRVRTQGGNLRYESDDLHDYHGS